MFQLLALSVRQASALAASLVQGTHVAQLPGDTFEFWRASITTRAVEMVITQTQSTAQSETLHMRWAGTIPRLYSLLHPSLGGSVIAY